MNNEIKNSQQNQLLDKLMRQSEGIAEASFITSVGGRVLGFVAKIISRYNFNQYYVRPVELGPAGTVPSVIGNQIVAVNIAEPFLSQGALTQGKYVIMFRLANTYVFYAPV